MARNSSTKCRDQGSPNPNSYKDNKHLLRNKSTNESPKKAAYDSGRPLPLGVFPEAQQVGAKDKFAGFNKKVKESLRHSIDSYPIDHPSSPRFMDYPSTRAAPAPSPAVSDAPDGSAEKVLTDGSHSDSELQESIYSQQRVQIKRLMIGVFLGFLIFSLLWWWWFPKSIWRTLRYQDEDDEVNVEKSRRRLKRQMCWFNMPCQYDCKEDEWTSGDPSRKYAKLHWP
uniref:Uncharacterized protein n=1 Tax=Physcomitrium patens TaxID=3218 RepID=A9TXT2_PHYPA|nr:hypothetical protein PHYPA_014666 [Physcomitrium patens]